MLDIPPRRRYVGVMHICPIEIMAVIHTVPVVGPVFSHYTGRAVAWTLGFVRMFTHERR